MPTKKKTARKKEDGGNENVELPAVASEAFEEALRSYAVALEQMHQGDLPQAREGFSRLIDSVPDEPALAQRAAMYRDVCDRRLTPAAPAPSTAVDMYHRAVVESNEGNADAAIGLLDRALELEPGSARILYARASAWALKGNAEAAVGDLRQAIAIEATIRFQAINDPDFSQIREEPAFIDIIEPTTSGA